MKNPIKTIKSIINDYYKNEVENKRLLLEIEWAHRYHDSIRGNEEIKGLGLNIGRWAGNYSFFFVLHQILINYSPKKIIEFGSGESTKFISSYNKSVDNLHTHIAIEHDKDWIENLKNKMKYHNYDIIHNPLTEKEKNGHKYNGYQNIDDIPTDGDLYIVDGPFGTEHFSRYDIVYIINKMKPNQQFILIFDDYNRKGEQETGQEVFNLLKEKKIIHYHHVYKGKKDQLIIGTERYKHIVTLG